MKTFLVLLMMSAATLERISQMPQWDNAARDGASQESSQRIVRIGLLACGSSAARRKAFQPSSDDGSVSVVADLGFCSSWCCDVAR